MLLLISKIDELQLSLEKLRLAEYLSHYNKPRRILWVNFLSGLARGFGMAIGFVILGAIAVFIIRTFLMENMPEIGEYIGQILEFANKYRSVR